MDDYFGEKGIQKEETKHTQSYSGQSAGVAWRAGLLTGLLKLRFYFLFSKLTWKHEFKNEKNINENLLIAMNLMLTNIS